MAKPTENRIRRRAREIWEENGRPSGRDEEFWFQAEREFHDAETLAEKADDASERKVSRAADLVLAPALDVADAL